MEKSYETKILQCEPDYGVFATTVTNENLPGHEVTHQQTFLTISTDYDDTDISGSPCVVLRITVDNTHGAIRLPVTEAKQFVECLSKAIEDLEEQNRYDSSQATASATT